jgi:glycine oxidase
MRVLVVGGGIIGCAVARELSGSGCSVIVLEKERVGCEASSAAAGVLCAQLDAAADSPLVGLGLESFRLYGEFVETLRRETGIDPQLDDAASLTLDMTRDDEAASLRLLACQRESGFPVERLSFEDVARLEPGLSQSILGGLLFPASARVDPAELTRALEVAARTRGVEFREGAPVLSLLGVGDRVTGVLLAGGERIQADCVVLSAGAWSSQLVPEIRIEVIPVRGQILVFDVVRPPRRHVLVTPMAYLAFRRNGSVLVGSTTERVGFRKGVTPKAMVKLTAAALALDPLLEGARFVGCWSGLRPGTSDSLPLLGPARPGLILATGHYRNGILLAPITAALVAEWVLKGKTTRFVQPFDPLRSRPAATEEATS